MLAREAHFLSGLLAFLTREHRGIAREHRGIASEHPKRDTPSFKKKDAVRLRRPIASLSVHKRSY